MAKRKRKCRLCKKNEATIPDRDTPWRQTPDICRECHGKRLLGDLRAVYQDYELRKRKTHGEGE